MAPKRLGKGVTKKLFTSRKSRVRKNKNNEAGAEEGQVQNGANNAVDLPQDPPHNPGEVPAEQEVQDVFPQEPLEIDADEPAEQDLPDEEVPPVPRLLNLVPNTINYENAPDPGGF